MSDKRLREVGGNRFFGAQAVLEEVLPSSMDIVAKSRRDMLRDAVYEFQAALSRLRTLAKRIDSLSVSLLSIGFEQLLLLEREEKRNEELSGKTRTQG